jgi:NADH-quinone oxidoreductase subunit N
VNDAAINAVLGSFGLVVPEMILGVTACVLFLGSTVRGSRNLWALLSLAALVAAMADVFLSATPFSPRDEALFAAPVVFDQFALLIKVIAIGTGFVLVLLSWNQVPDRHAPDYFACLLLVVTGMCLVGAANELVTLFLALELVSIPTYVLMYLPRHDDAAQEAAIKYFLLSIFSSALMLFGFSYLYGLTGTTNLPAVLDTLNKAGPNDLPLLSSAALILIVAGLGFRITAVPFHFYAPDVFQGAPVVVAAFLAVVPKVAGFAGLIRVLGLVLPAEVVGRHGMVGLALSDQVPILLWWLAAVTMFLGNLLALWQDNLKRLLAYSSVAHAGYMLVGLAVAPYLGAGSVEGGVSATLFYLVAYAAMTLGAFGVIAYLDTPGRPVENVDDLSGLSGTRPGLALMMAVFLFSLIGIPATAGFTGKLLVFLGAMAVPSPQHAQLFQILALVGVVNAAIGAWYYLRIINVMYLRQPVQPVSGPRAWPGLATLWVCLVLTVGLSCNPGAGWLMAAARDAIGRAPATQQLAQE